MIKNYYQNLLKDINELVENNSFDKALTLIHEELSMSYVPMNVEDELKVLFNKIMTKSDFSKIDLNTEKLINLLKSNKISSFDKNEILKLLDEVNLSKYINLIKDLLVRSDEKLSFLTKARIVLKLVDEKYQSKIIVNFENKEHKLNLKDIKHYKNDKNFAKDSSKLERILSGNKNISDICFQVLEDVYIAKIFKRELSDYNEYWKPIILIFAKIFNQEDILNRLLKENIKLENKIEEQIKLIKHLTDLQIK